MQSLTASCVDNALMAGLWLLKATGTKEESRNGPVLVAPGPVVTTYPAPQQRVLFNATRDANPVFHLLEALWMIAGRNDVAPLLAYNSTFDQFAEEDGTVHGAYGFRWRRMFNFDQLECVVDVLQKSPNTRQAVMAMWSPGHDLGEQKKDIPCNTHIYFDLRGGVLNMTVCCRSNDIIWGAYGANAVHFSILQELIAAAVEAPIGVYRQFSNNFHLYTELPLAKRLLENLHTGQQLYQGTPMSLVDSDRGETWLDFVDDCETLFDDEDDEKEFATQFVKMAYKLARSYRLRKRDVTYTWLVKQLPEDNDWVIAFKQWCDRRAD